MDFLQNRPIKDSIQKHFFGQAELYGVSGDVLGTAGPRFKEHVEMYGKITKGDIYVVEKYPDIYNQQIQALDTLGQLKERTNIVLGDIRDMQAREFIDADLMKTCKYDGTKIQELLHKQSRIRKTMKGLVMTFSNRGATKDETMKWINKMLWDEIRADLGEYDLTDMDMSLGSRTYKYKILPRIKSYGRMLSFDAYFYNDNGGPMTTACVIYK